MNRSIGYDIGSWFAAYLINDVGQEKIFEFYESLDKLGFENSFIKSFGKSYRDYVDDFERFLKMPIDDIFKIFP